MNVWEEIRETKRLLDLALKQARLRGIAMNAAEAHYYTTKDYRVRMMMDEGMSATAIQMIVKGEKDVSEAMNKYHDLQVEYKNACEAVNVYKKWFDFLREQYQREWSQSGSE